MSLFENLISMATEVSDVAERIIGPSGGAYLVGDVLFMEVTGNVLAQNLASQQTTLLFATSTASGAAFSMLYGLGPSGSASGLVDVTAVLQEFPSGMISITPAPPESSGYFLTQTILDLGLASLYPSPLGLLSLVRSDGGGFYIRLETSRSLMGWSGTIRVTDKNGTSASLSFTGQADTTQDIDLPAGLDLGDGAQQLYLTANIPQDQFMAMNAESRRQMRPVSEKLAQRVALAAKQLRA